MIHVEQAIRRLRAAFPTFACGPETVAVYAEKLVHIAPHAVLRAADECIEQLDRFPTVAQLLERCRQPAYYEKFVPLPDWKDSAGDRGENGGVLRYGYLAGQRWERHEILNSKGVRGFPCPLFYRAKRAAEDAIGAILDENIRRNREHENPAPSQPSGSPQTADELWL